MNTCVGVVRDGEIKYRVHVAPPDFTGYWWSLPVVAETWDALERATFIGNDHLDPLFHATVHATEEAVDNALIAARDMCGEDGHCVKAVPHRRLVWLLTRYGRYKPPH